MMTTITRVEQVPQIARDEVLGLASTEQRRMVELLRSLEPDDWARPTDCTGWDVRALASHVLGGTEVFSSVGEFVRQARAARKEAGDGPFIDGMTAVQVRELAPLTPEELIERLAAAGPRVARNRAGLPGLLRRIPMKQDLNDGTTETWRMGYLVDVILTRDTWMHRVDIARATGREMVLSADHDGRIVADVVAEWARRHGQPFTLELTGPIGTTFVNGDGADPVTIDPVTIDPITIDAVEYCRTISGRASGPGLLTQEVPF